MKIIIAQLLGVVVGALLYVGIARLVHVVVDRWAARKEAQP